MLAELEQLVVDHPFRESGWERLTRLLYRRADKRDALIRLGVLRRILADELGLDPGPSIVEVETAILNHDPIVATAGRRSIGSARRARRSSSRLPAIRPWWGVRLIEEVVDFLSQRRR